MSGPIETAILAQLADQMGGREALDRIIGMYTGKLPGEIEELQAAFDSGDLEAVRFSAHRLKSSSGQLGAERLAAMLSGLEATAREGDPEACARILAEVSDEARTVQSELESMVGRR